MVVVDLTLLETERVVAVVVQVTMVSTHLLAVMQVQAAMDLPIYFVLAQMKLVLVAAVVVLESLVEMVVQEERAVEALEQVRQPFLEAMQLLTLVRVVEVQVVLHQ
jgi:hypothetical protein